jgi:adenylosuccinate synthase
LRRATPVYETLAGWKPEITSCRKWDELPANAQVYLDRISALVGQPVEMVSVGPERDQTIVVKKS